MIINLIRKDILLIRKYILIMAICSVVAPVLLIKRTEVPGVPQSYLGLIIFFIVMIISVLFLSNSISMAEEKYSKGCAYLCTTPYTRRQMVISRYIFTYLVVLGYCLVYEAVHLVAPDLTIVITKEVLIVSLLCVSIFRGILIPLEYKYGYEKAKYIITFSIIGLPFIASYVMGRIQFDMLKWDGFLNEQALLLIGAVVIVVINMISVVISCHIFENKEF
ncbi:ABC-2 type transport system permease protein [Lachnospiraceae bacterium A10]|nr:ABC-2 type transport system permease protein [Lachnospiraceae bacterium A10]